MKNIASALWALFRDFDGHEKARVRALMGYHALEAEFAVYWRGQLLSEWAGLLSLINALRNDEGALSALVKSGPRDFTRAQWLATLAFLGEISPENAPCPTLSEMAVLLTLARGEGARTRDFVNFCSALILLQRQRAKLFDFSRHMPAAQAEDCLRSLEQMRRFLPLYIGPAPLETRPTLKLAA